MAAAGSGKRRRLHGVPLASVQTPVSIATTASLAGSVGTALQGAVSDGVITRQLQQQGVAPLWLPSSGIRLHTWGAWLVQCKTSQGQGCAPVYTQPDRVMWIRQELGLMIRSPRIRTAPVERTAFDLSTMQCVCLVNSVSYCTPSSWLLTGISLCKSTLMMFTALQG